MPIAQGIQAPVTRLLPPFHHHPMISLLEILASTLREVTSKRSIE